MLNIPTRGSPTETLVVFFINLKLTHMFEIITSVIMLVPTGEKADNGKEMFNLFIDDKVIVYVYKEEVKQFYKTGIFKYNEDLVFEAQGD